MNSAYIAGRADAIAGLPRHWPYPNLHDYELGYKDGLHELEGLPLNAHETAAFLGWCAFGVFLLAILLWCAYLMGWHV